MELKEMIARVLLADYHAHLCRVEAARADLGALSVEDPSEASCLAEEQISIIDHHTIRAREIRARIDDLMGPAWFGRLEPLSEKEITELLGQAEVEEPPPLSVGDILSFARPYPQLRVKALEDRIVIQNKDRVGIIKHRASWEGSGFSASLFRISSPEAARHEPVRSLGELTVVLRWVSEG